MAVATDKPVLDEKTFQRLLAAAYTLQEYVDRPLAVQAEKIQVSMPLTNTPLRPGPTEPCAQVVDQIESPPEFQRQSTEATESGGKFADVPNPLRSAGKKVLKRQLFWRFAAAALLSTLSGFVMGTHYHPFSALSLTLSLASQGGQQSVRLQSKQHGLTIPVSTSPVELAGDAEHLISMQAIPARPRYARARRLHHSRSSEAYVAPDTVIHYSTGFSATGSQLQQEP
jgi:hypothetical protein